MRKQVGWYDPEREIFCYMNQKQEVQGCEKYVIPVFADDGLDQTYPWHEIQLQILENQCAMLLGLLKTPEFLDMRVNIIKMRKNTVNLLQKGRESS